MLKAAEADIGRAPLQSWLLALSPWRFRGLAVVMGALATLGHAPFQVVPAYVIAVVALVWMLDAAAARARPLWSGFVTAFSFGLGHFATGMYWVSSAFLVDTTAWGPLWGVPATAALAAVLALFWGAGGALAIALWTPDLRRLASFALALCVTEWLRGHLFTGLPWLLPGYIWSPGEPISQLASLVGIYGLSLATLLVAAAPATIADQHAGAHRRFAPLIAAGLAIGLAWGWGAQRLAGAPIDPPGAAPIVRVADPGLSQAEKWAYAPDQEYRVLAAYSAVSGAAEESRASILIWPEGAIPTVNFFMLDNSEFLAALGAVLGDRALIAGFSRCEPRPLCDGFWQGRGDPSRLRLFNSAAVIDGVGGQARVSPQIYDKHHRVPFGEYIPFWRQLSQIEALQGMLRPLQRIGLGFEQGAPPARLVVPEAPPAVVLICYEAIFPGMTPRGAERPGWIVSLTNDAWFGDGSGPWQHYAMARYRAIEEGLPLARAASGGVSAIVDSFGRQVQANARDGGFAEAQLPPALPETVFRRWGGWLLPVLLFAVTALRFFPRQNREMKRGA